MATKKTRKATPKRKKSRKLKDLTPKDVKAVKGGIVGGEPTLVRIGHK